MPAITIADLSNAKLDVDHIAEIATSSALTATDRAGNVKRTIAGALSEYPNAMANAAQAAASATASGQSAIAAATSAALASTSASTALTAVAEGIEVGVSAVTAMANNAATQAAEAAGNAIAAASLVGSYSTKSIADTAMAAEPNGSSCFVYADGSFDGYYIKEVGTLVRKSTDTFAALTFLVRDLAKKVKGIAPPGYEWAVLDQYLNAVLGISGGITQIAEAFITKGRSADFGIGDVRLRPASAPGWASNLADSFGNIAAGFKDDGVFVVKKSDVGVLKVDELRMLRSPVANLPGLILFPSYGQSLSQGGLATPAISTTAAPHALRFVGGVRPHDGGGDIAANHASLVPLIETNDAPGPSQSGETPCYGFQEMLYQLLADYYSGFNPESCKVLGVSPGQGGTSISGLSKGSASYTRLLAAMSYGVARASELNKTVKVGCLGWTQSEQDIADGTSAATYSAALLQLQADAEADAQSIMGTADLLPLLTYQAASWKKIGASAPTIALAALGLSEQYPARIVMACPMYMLQHQADNIHLTPSESRRYGAYLAIAFFNHIVLAKPWVPLKPVSVFRQGRVFDIKFNVPSGAIEIDTTLVSAAANHGFSLATSNGTSVAIVSVTQTHADAFRVVAATDMAAGARIQYGHNGAATAGPGTGPRGNLRDMQGDQLTYHDQPMHNWCVTFDIAT